MNKEQKARHRIANREWMRQWRAERNPPKNPKCPRCPRCMFYLNSEWHTLHPCSEGLLVISIRFYRPKPIHTNLEEPVQ